MSVLSYLFCLECELNKDLLELLIHKVDAELLKAILLQAMQEHREHPPFSCTAAPHSDRTPSAVPLQTDTEPFQTQPSIATVLQDPPPMLPHGLYAHAQVKPLNDSIPDT